jgi:CDGSH-type Zn-finger protein
MKGIIMGTIKINAKENGPLLIPGKATYVNAEGVTVETKGDAIALCRCGRSANAPFCDGKHKEGFTEATCELNLVTPE